MFNIWTGLGEEKIRTPQQFGIGVAYVGPDTYFPSDAERQRATQISIAKGVVSPTTSWKTCASIDSITGECASFTVGQDAQPLPAHVLRSTLPPPGIIPPNIPIRGGGLPGGGSQKVFQAQSCSYAPPPAGCSYKPGPQFDSATNCGLVLDCPTPIDAQPTCPPGQRLIGMTQSFPGSPICEPIGGSSDGGSGSKPTQPSRPNQHRRLRDSGGRSSAVELCPLSGYVTRPVPGASEYQVYKCRPGERVPINLRFDPQRRGLQEAGIREALQRADVSGQPAGVVGAESAASPNWLLIGGIAIGAYLLLGRRGR